MFRFGILIGLNILLINQGSIAQDSVFLTHATLNLSRQPATEKVYLHLDKPNYGFGDTIWYKAYTVIGPRHQLSALSGVLYVELISPQDSLVTRQVIPLVSGIGWGSLPLLHSLRPGSYRVRAYTNWMRNFGEASFYDQRISLGGPAPVKKSTSDSKPDVQFFPEGGSLVAGIRSRVAFKAVAQNGLGEPITGAVVDEEGHTIAEIVTQHAGMGEFAFTPQLNKTYQANVVTAKGGRFSVPLPKALPAGYVLTVNNSLPDSIYLNIGLNDQAMAAQNGKGFYIVAQSNDKVYYTTEGKSGLLNCTASVEKSRFPSGIAQFTLFSADGGAVAERIIYIEGKDTLQLKATGLPVSSGTRQPVTINLGAADAAGKPVAGSFSVSVINESSAVSDENSESTLVNNLLLTSQLKGYVEKPNYYFINKNDQTYADLDLLMLTQGYRRFEWKQVLSDTLPTLKYLPGQSLEIAGVIKTPAGKPVPDGKITLIVNKENLLKDTTADAQGNFKFTNLYLPDTSIVVLQARKQNNGSNVHVEVMKVTYAAMTKNPADTLMFNVQPGQPTAALTLQYEQYQKQQKDFVANGIKLKQVNIQAYRHKEPDLSQSQTLHKGNADQVIMGDQLGLCLNLIDCLRGKAVFINYDSHNRPVSRLGVMSVIVNGIIMGGAHLNDVNPNEIYSIEVLRSVAAKSIYGTSIEPGGALVITLKNGGEEKKDLNAVASGITSFPFLGYTKTREFYVPKYSPKNAAELNLGSTIYWKPNIITGADGNTTLEYFNNDTKGTYRVVIEGIDDEGNLGRAVYRYTVQ